jgi:nucleotide-binding universal stress UspA family protein
MFPIATILYPTDFSPSSDNTFHLACSLARERGARIIILHVAELPLVASAAAMIHPPPGGIRQAIDEQLRSLHPPIAGVLVEHRLEEGDPAAEILRVAQESKCDLIVMGAHGHTGLARLLMGSVAEEVMRWATCPVLIVKAPLREYPAKTNS